MLAIKLFLSKEKISGVKVAVLFPLKLKKKIRDLKLIIS